MVWELTLRCDLACRHCGSRAGKPRDRELSVAEALGVVAQLAAAGTAEITFIGGEAYLYREWLQVVEATARAGITATLTTGGRGFDAEMARRAAAAGLAAVNVSVDGLEGAHDTLRNVRGSHARAMGAIAATRDAGMEPHANTQVNRLNLPELEGLADSLFDAGIVAWQVQVTGPMGRAADQPDWLLQPYDFLDFVPRLAKVAERARERGIRLEVANNLGYFGPHEGVLRRGLWRGCQAGRFLLGIEADGSVKGCPSLPSAPYVGGNVRDTPILELMQRSPEIRFSQERSIDELWGFCAGCYYAEECRGGCSWTAHTLLGRRGNLPYCHHRALELATLGLRERLVRVEPAPGQPFDFGRFEIVVEAFGGAAGATTQPSGAGLSFGVEAAEPSPSSREAS
ncbi:MAG: radical SAM protein [Myxococcota bacterium]